MARAREKKKSIAERIVETTQESVGSKLHKLTALQLGLWLSPFIDEIAEDQERRIRKIATAAQVVDPEWRRLFKTADPMNSTKITSNEWRIPSYYIVHKPVCGIHPYQSGRFTTSGRELVTFTIDANIPAPEEVLLSYMTELAAAKYLPEWTSQFGSQFDWSDAQLGRMCAFSPLYRACLALPRDVRKAGYELPAYKYGPRGVDEIKHMSPELVHALQIASNMEDEEEVSF